tara:strand:+ start:677 stop:919 length:243 start_codon:yes stop_codon:yes gene_type:complete
LSTDKFTSERRQHFTFNEVINIAGESLSKPNRTDFLLAKGKLLSLFNKLEPLVYHDEQERALLEHPLADKALLIVRKLSG